MKVVSVAEMRALEQATFAAGTSEAALQRRAGTAVADAIVRLQLVDIAREQRGVVVALIGPGNNGRDAWIAAEALRARGWDSVLYLTPRHAIGEGELAEHAAAGGRVVRHDESRPDASLAGALAGAHVAIDGLLGIGTRGPLRPPLDRIAVELNAWRATHGLPHVVAVDNPSGLDADTGEAPGAVVCASATVVLGGAKRGLLTPSAARFTGELVFAEIGLVPGPAGAPEILERETVRGLRPPRRADAHKGTFGRLLVVAGSERYVGAAYLTCAAAVRAGAGVVTLAGPRWLRDVVAARLAEITYLPLPDAGLAGAPEECATAIRAELDGFQAIALGPGLSMEGEVGLAVELLLHARAARGIPAVVDADGLNALAQRPDWPRWIGPDVVITPHPGELARLTSEHSGGEEPPWERARNLASAWGVTLVVKGPFTAVGAGGDVWVHARPNPALATAGTGDVLTGVIGGLLAQGVAPAAAALLGVRVHGEAGAVIARERGQVGLMASELLDRIPVVFAGL